MTLDVEKIRFSIETAIGSDSDKSIPSSDIAFHMTDWLTDLDRYHKFCINPEKYSAEEIKRTILDFLIHVPNHVAAASVLFTGIPVADVFGVGAVDTKTNKG